MSEHRPPVLTETLAEGLRACLAMVAVVLLARLHGGAFDQTPPAGVVLFVSSIMWAAAAGATYLSRPTGGSIIGLWKNCVAPALITLIVGGTGSVSLLLAEMATIGLGTLAVGYIALWAQTVALRSAKERPNLEPTTAALPVAPLTPALSPTVESVLVAESIVGEREQSVPPLEHLPTVAPEPPLRESLSISPEFVEEQEDSAATESWTRHDLDGEVSIEAVLLARFAEGSKLAVVHLPFVPPLPEVPQIECEPLDSGCDVTITIDAAYRHGAKLSITRQSAGPVESAPLELWSTRASQKR